MGDPPDHVELNVTDCPLSIVGFEGEIVGADSTGLIITSLLMELVVSGVVALSVTNVQYHVLEVGLTELNVALPLVKEDSVWTKVDPVLHVGVVEEYRLAV